MINTKIKKKQTYSFIVYRKEINSDIKLLLKKRLEIIPQRQSRPAEQ